MFSTKRLSKELQKIHEHLPPGITLASAPDFQEWHMDIQVLDTANALYAHHTFRLRLKFSDKYPIRAPGTTFIPLTGPVTRPIPLHPHVYSNGIICLDLLGPEGWSPVHNVQSVCISIQSMLASNTRAERPPDDAAFCRSVGGVGEEGGFRGDVGRIGFVYHDNAV